MTDQASTYHADDICNLQVFLHFPNQIHTLHWPKVSINISFETDTLCKFSI